MNIHFPSAFFWGASISSYQVEGGISNNDWFKWEQTKGIQPAGKATSHYSQFRNDFALAKKLNLNSLRFSIEWSRVIPQQGVVEQSAIAHYIEVLKELSKHEIIPFVTLHHFTNPLWFIDQGGWLQERNIKFFIEYVELIVRYIGEYARYWIIFNEPLVYIYNGFTRGIWPPGHCNVGETCRVLVNMVRAYRQAYRIIKCGTEKWGGAWISIAKHLRAFLPCPYGNRIANSAFARIREHLFNWRLLHYLLRKKWLDMICINYYCGEFVSAALPFGEECKAGHHQLVQNSMGWYIYPQGLAQILRYLKRFKLPVIVTENGIPLTQGFSSQLFLEEHLKTLARALKEGVEVKGYFWWSLLDNFEWLDGYDPRFGLIEVDYHNLTRTIRPFALYYKEIIENNGIAF